MSLNQRAAARSILWCLTAIALIVSFQNCSGGFKTMGSDPASRDVLLSAPQIIMNDSPDIYSTNNVSFSFTANVSSPDSISSTMCQLGNQAAQDCSSGAITFNNLVDGDYSLNIVVLTSRGQRQEARKVFRKDSTAPVIVVSAMPPVATSATSAQFTFTVTDNLSGVRSIECSLNNAVFANCISPLNLTGLAAGSNNFRIRAQDQAGNMSLIYSHTWVIDLTVPTVTITSQPLAATNQVNASFSFAGNGIVSYECQLDNGAYAACTSPQTYTNLAAIAHTFRVRGTNAAGIVSASTTYNWTIDNVAPNTPTLTSNVPAITNLRAATMTFSSVDAGSGIASYQCSLDNVAFTNCTSPHALANLVDGNHSLRVRSLDNAGNTSDLSIFSWLVDGTNPVIAFSQAPAATTTSTAANFTFTVTEINLASVQCSLDNAAFSNCTSPVNLTNLSVSAHTFRVQVRDTAGNSALLAHNWTISAAPVPTPTPSLAGLFVTLPASGTVDVTLHPSSQAVGVANQTVIFGVPFPKSAVSDVNMIRVLDSNNQEIPSQVAVLNSWRDFQNPANAISIRSARIVIQRTFANTNPMTVRISYGVSRTLNLAGTFDVSATWQSISLGPNPTEYPASGNVREPLVYATLSPDWMSACLLQTRFAAANSVPAYATFDSAFLRHSTTATTGTAYQTGSEPWLYDRAQTLYIAYFRTGDINRLRSAHRAAQFYKANINAGGGFALGGDSKYVYGQSMLYDLMLTADQTLVPVIERALQPHAGWTTTFSANTGFWTERNSAYALHAALAAYDATGNSTYAARARALFNSYFSMQQTPINNWVKNGCPLHTNVQHDPSEVLPNVMCSPWMGALMSDAIWKYYLLSLDNNALIYLSDYADYIQLYTLYNDGALRLPYYGATSYGHTDPDGDQEHTCDVMGALVRGSWAKKALGRDPASLVADRTSLISACQSNVNGSGLSPLRKYSWWFGTNSDFSWFMSNL